MKWVLLLGVVLLLAAGCGGGGKLGAKALSQQARSLQSDAAEGALLAEDVFSGKTTRVYTRQHSDPRRRALSRAVKSCVDLRVEGAVRPGGEIR
jgi:hypothetical protein